MSSTTAVAKLIWKQKSFGQFRQQEKLEEITSKDIADLDEFHIRKSAATREMAELIYLQPGASILDAGSGLGRSNENTVTE